MDITKVLTKGNVVDRSYYFRKCSYKPSIKVQYKQVSGGTAIELDIFVSNFYLTDASGNCIRSFDVKSNPLRRVEVMLGYFNQFKNTFDPENGTMEQYMTLEPTDLIDKIVMDDVQYVTVDKMPPDYTMHIHGYVGDVMSAPKNAKEEIESFTDLTKASREYNLSQLTYEQFFQKCITEQFTVKNGDKEEGMKVVVAKSIKDEIVSEPVKDADGGDVDVKISLDGSLDLRGLMQKVKEINKNIQYKIKNDGSVFIYTTVNLFDAMGIPDIEQVKELSENSEKMLSNAIKNNDGILPAVNSINVSALSLIVCPYFGFLDPFQSFKFKTRYALTNLVTYYASVNLAVYKFYALNVSVSFATVEDVNEMQVKAVTENYEGN